MREIRLSGSVRGVRRKPYPYRDPRVALRFTPPPHRRGPICGDPRAIFMRSLGSWIALGVALSGN
jgi:hypothetical protein